MYKPRIIPLITVLLIVSIKLNGQTLADSIYLQNQRILKILESSSFSTQIFLGYRYYEEGNNNFNEFTVKRGYINFKKSLNKHLTGRITPDITVDKEGDGEGDLEMRLKYCYMELKDEGDYWIFTNPKILVGEVFTPWIEFEERINVYRVTGSHFMDYEAIVSSADFGFVVTSLLGGKVDDTYQKNVSNAYPGKYGSVAVGIYNGGGYHAMEKNNNKTTQWRVTLRPIPDLIPGFQLSYTGAYGKGNTALYPSWRLNAGIASFEASNITTTAQYFNSLGNFEGSLADSLGNSHDSNGYSFFAEAKLLKKKFSVFGRYDHMTVDEKNRNVNSNQKIIGVAYHIYERNKVVFDYNHNTVDGKSVGIIEVMLELAL